MLTKSDTQLAKGVAICLMVFHHLFRFPERLHNVDYISIFSFNSIPLEFFIAGFGKICVSIFLFLSGYGIYLTSIKKEGNVFQACLKRLLKFLSYYWLCFIIFIPIGLIYFSDNWRYIWEPLTFIQNLIGFNDSYNGEWWFVQIYLQLIFLFSFIFYFLKKNSFYTLLFSIFLCLFPYKILSMIPYIGSSLSSFFFWQIFFILGCCFAKHSVFNLFPYEKSNNPIRKFFMYTFILIVCFLFRAKFSVNFIDIIIAPIFIFYSIQWIKSSYLTFIFKIFGDYSLYIWLTHTFFCYYFWQPIIFFPKYSVLIFSWLMLLCLITAWILDNIYNKLVYFKK